MENKKIVKLNKKEKELKEKSNIKHLSNTAIKFYIKEVEENGGKEKAIINRLKKEDLKLNNYIYQKEVEHVRIEIEWKKSSTWGANPHATAFIRYKNGDFEEIKASCSGCGYDKESTVIASIYNKIFKYKLLKIQKNNTKKKKAPYGIYWSNFVPCFDGGIGVSCYYKITEYIGGKFKDIAHTKHDDIYEIIMR